MPQSPQSAHQREPARAHPQPSSGRAAGCGCCLRGPAGGAAAPRWPRSLPSAVLLEQPETSWRHFEAGRGTGASCGRGGGWRRLAAAAAAAAPLRAWSGGSAERTRLRPARRGGCGGVRSAAPRPRVPPPYPRSIFPSRGRGGRPPGPSSAASAGGGRGVEGEREGRAPLGPWWSSPFPSPSPLRGAAPLPPFPWPPSNTKFSPPPGRHSGRWGDLGWGARGSPPRPGGPAGGVAPSAGGSSPREVAGGEGGAGRLLARGCE